MCALPLINRMIKWRGIRDKPCSKFGRN